MRFFLKNIVFFGGAGVSTESGIPDFRSEGGIFQAINEYGVRPEVILSHTFFMQNPEVFFKYYKKTLLYPDAKPNDCHKALAKLEEMGKLKAVVTQNIDDLHQRAGSKNVLELHGSIHRNRCLKCARFFPPEYIRDSDGIPVCDREVDHQKGTRSVCGGVIKPEVVLYEEGLDDDVLSEAVHHIRQADTMIIAGTSLTVFPAASLVHYFKGQNLVLINRDVTPMDEQATLVIRDSVGKVLSQLNCT